MTGPKSLTIPGSFLAIQEKIGDEPFSPKDVVRIVGKGMKGYAELARLTDLGWLLRLGRGRYATVDPLVRLTPGVEKNLRPFRSKCFYPILHRAVGAMLRVYAGRLRGIILYGSTARGSSGPHSDVDVLAVVSTRPVSAFEEVRQQLPVSDAVRSLVREEVRANDHIHSVHVVQVEETAFSRPGPLLYDIPSDGVLLFDSRDAVRGAIARLRALFRRASVRRRETADGTVYWDTGDLKEMVEA